MKRFTVCDFVLPILALCLLLGLFFVFGPCGIKEDGGWMTCHWAGQALRGIAALELALALLHLIPAPHERKIGLDMALIGTSVLAVCIPGYLVGLCMMADMRCRSVMTPAVTVLSGLLIVAALADLLLRRGRK